LAGFAAGGSGVGVLAATPFWAASTGTLNVGAAAGGGQADFFDVDCSCSGGEGAEVLPGPGLSPIVDFGRNGGESPRGGSLFPVFDCGGTRLGRVTGVSFSLAEAFFSSADDFSPSAAAFLAFDIIAASRRASIGPLISGLSRPEALDACRVAIINAWSDVSNT
jgi:hypothetical protein